MNCARPHTDQTQHDGETPRSMAEKLRAIGYEEPVLLPPRLSPAEEMNRALRAVDRPCNDCPCDDCPCDGMGALTAAFLLAIGAVVGIALTLFAKG